MLNLWCTMEPASTLSIGRKSNAATSPPAADTSLWTSAATLVGAGFVRTTKLVATTLFMSCVNSLSSCAVGTKRVGGGGRSEERRGGEEGRSRWAAQH